jgi:farnesyl-diphosphate farnesyltransferase/isopentenyl-diphosphate delta-isomerase type 1
MAKNGCKVWSADGMSQDDFMLKDECILLDFADSVIGHDNKYNAHKWVVGQPRGMLHRAFSVMLFDKCGRLLLQQRASDKITFPDVWTNTCCSHPLYGMAASEVDSPEATASGKPTGVFHAAIRKLGHELGIKASDLDVNNFAFVTRVHYAAADTVTHGPDAPWGEHELDYLLSYKLDIDGEKLSMTPHPEEVRDTRWVTKEELFTLMEEKREMPLWSPWFRIIARKFLEKTWWGSLQDKEAVEKQCKDWETIHRFDCPDHLAVDGIGGGQGGATPFLDDLEKQVRAASPEDVPAILKSAFRKEMLSDISSTTSVHGRSGSALKQGAYGKVPTHSHSKLDQLLRPREVIAGLAVKFAPKLVGLRDNLGGSSDEDVRFCDDMLCKVSRSFAAVIQQLPAGCCIDICVFYLVLRALDTVEDDMTFYLGNEKKKEDELRSFATTRLLNDTLEPIRGCGEGDERVLLENFGAVARVFASLPKTSRDVIQDVTQKMGDGMAHYVTAELAQGTQDTDDYNLYCHNVAGLVGEGLTGIFVGREYESRSIEEGGSLTWPFCSEKNHLGLANSMGLFLQKTNIIRDYLEDYVDGRAFWPRSVWTKYATISDLGDFTRPAARGGGDAKCINTEHAAKIVTKGASDRALHCLNDLVADALELVPDALEYLSRLRTPEVYRFCAIPQVMAIATLYDCFDNEEVFTGVVKIRKGAAARLIVDTQRGHATTLQTFRHYALMFQKRAATCRAPPAVQKRVAEAAAAILKETPEPSLINKYGTTVVALAAVGAAYVALK